MKEDNGITELNFIDYTEEGKNYGGGNVVLLGKYSVDFEYVVEYDETVRISDFTAYDEDGEIVIGLLWRFRLALELLIEKDTKL
tara:strand:- start:518 stop:769 length:252 start_codon:yes stop_codon:yes gene_type:complete